MGVRCKFMVTSVTEVERGSAARQIVMTPQYDTSIPEDQQFQKATPSGRFEMRVDNPTALEQLPISKMVYIDITPVEG